MTTDIGARPLPASDVAGQAERLARFTRTERGVHWVQAVTFMLLLASGFALALPQLEALIGHRALLREIHLSAAFFFVFGPAIVALSGDRRSVAQDVADIDTWDSDDLRWLIPFPILRLFGVRTPPQGRFNAGQKLNALFVVWSTVTFSVTGLLMWQNRRFPTNLVESANNIHTLLAYLALLGFLGHLFLATTYPATRHAFRAITQGWVRRDWAEHHHAKWVQAQMAALPQSAARHDAFRTGVQIVLGLAIAGLATRIGFFALGANPTDKVTGWIYNATAWPGSASIQPQTGVHVLDVAAVVYLAVCTLAWWAVDRLRQR